MTSSQSGSGIGTDYRTLNERLSNSPRMLRGWITRTGRVTYFNDTKRREEASDEMMHAMLERKLLLKIGRRDRFGEDVPLKSKEVRTTNEKWLVGHTHHNKGTFCCGGAKEEKEDMK